MDLSEINQTCKSTIFKNILSDLMYSFRMSIKKLTGAKADIKLDKIKTTPIAFENGSVVAGRISNLVGGKILCAFDDNFNNFLESQIEYDGEPTKLFALDFFDNFSSISKNGILELNTDNLDMSIGWDKALYYIRFETKIIDRNGKVIPTKFMVSVDEITSMYFTEN